MQHRIDLSRAIVSRIPSWRRSNPRIFAAIPLPAWLAPNAPSVIGEEAPSIGEERHVYRLLVLSA